MSRTPADEDTGEAMDTIVEAAWKGLKRLVPGRLRGRIREELIERAAVRAYGRIFAGGTPFFHQLQLETCSFCNNDCAFCPASRERDVRGKRFMPEAVIERVIDELEAISFNGLISLFNNNEPLLDARIGDIIREIRSRLPAPRIEIFTNGLTLSLEILEDLFGAGLDSLVINHYYAGSEALPARIGRLRELSLQRTFGGKITIRQISKDAVRSNRAGNAANKPPAERFPHFCPYPFMQFNVNWRADVSLCCADAYYESVMGNVMESGIAGVWRSAGYAKIREMLLERKRDFGICRRCDVLNHSVLASRLVVQRNNQILLPDYICNEVKFVEL